MPWQQVAVDLIGPWEFRDAHGDTHEIQALTIVDVVTTYCEIVRLDNKTADHVGWQFEHQWLACYPRPDEVISDQGPEFIGEGFQRILRKHGIHFGSATARNPQANSVCERLHQSVGNSLRALVYAHPPETEEEAKHLVDSALQTAAYAARAAMHSTMQLSPGAMAFGRDMILNIPIIADFELLRQRRQALIDRNLVKANLRRVNFDYQPGQQVVKLVPKPGKLQPRAEGPYPIESVHTNGTVVIRLSPIVTERVNIRHIKPYRQ